VSISLGRLLKQDYGEAAGSAIDGSKRPTGNVRKWIVVPIASAVALYAFSRKQTVTVAWDGNPAATSYNCYLDGVRVAVHIPSDVLRCTVAVSVGFHAVGVTSVGSVTCGPAKLCEDESPAASLKFVKLPWLKARRLP
jgi:hypothetical protein